MAINNHYRIGSATPTQPATVKFTQPATPSVVFTRENPTRKRKAIELTF